MYGSLRKIQESEQIAILLLFHLCQYSFGGNLVEVFILIVENTTIIKQSKAYQVIRII